MPVIFPAHNSNGAASLKGILCVIFATFGLFLCIGAVAWLVLSEYRIIAVVVFLVIMVLASMPVLCRKIYKRKLSRQHENQAENSIINALSQHQSSSTRETMVVNTTATLETPSTGFEMHENTSDQEPMGRDEMPGYRLIQDCEMLPPGEAPPPYDSIFNDAPICGQVKPNS